MPNSSEVKTSELLSAADTHQSSPSAALKDTTEQLSPLVPDQVVSPPSQNALKHGAYSQKTVLSWESAEEFDRLLRSYTDDFNPEGAYQEDQVQLIATLEWKVRRLLSVHALTFLTDPQAEEWTEAGAGGWEGIQQYVRDKRPPVQETPEETSPVSGSEVINDPSNPYHGLAVAAVQDAGEIKKMFARTKLDLESRASIRRMSRQNDLDSIVKTLGSLETQIQKAVSRLILHKEYQLKYGRKTISP